MVNTPMQYSSAIASGYQPSRRYQSIYACFSGWWQCPIGLNRCSLMAQHYKLVYMQYTSTNFSFSECRISNIAAGRHLHTNFYEVSCRLPCQEFQILLHTTNIASPIPRQNRTSPTSRAI